MVTVWRTYNNIITILVLFAVVASPHGPDNIWGVDKGLPLGRTHKLRTDMVVPSVLAQPPVLTLWHCPASPFPA